MTREAGHAIDGNSQSHCNGFPKAETILKSKHYLRKHFVADEGSLVEPVRDQHETVIRAMSQDDKYVSVPAAERRQIKPLSAIVL